MCGVAVVANEPHKLGVGGCHLAFSSLLGKDSSKLVFALRASSSRVHPPQQEYVSVAQWIRASRYEREGRKFESCRKYRQDKGFDRLRMGEIVKAFVIMPPPRDVQVYALLWLGHPQVH